MNHNETTPDPLQLDLTAHFDGTAYDEGHDRARLVGQIARVHKCLAVATRRGVWMTLSEIRDRTGDPEASISAQIRNLRKRRFGSHTVEKRRRGEPGRGLWEYRLEPERPLAHG